MNGSVIDIPGININVNVIDMEDSTDKVHILKINDGNKSVTIEIIYNKITKIITHE